MKTIRNIESISGTGRLWRDESSLGEIDYTLDIYQEFLDEETPSLKSGGGTLFFENEVASMDLILEPSNLQLELSDSRSVHIVPNRLTGKRVTFVTSGPLE